MGRATLRFSFVLALLAAVATGLAAPAQTKDDKKKPTAKLKPVPVKESLFLIYALEDLYRARLPDNAEELETFVSRQQVPYDQLLVYFSKQKNRDAELAVHFDEYGKALAQIRELAKEIEASKKKHWAPIVEALLKLRYEEMRQANGVLMAGLYHGADALAQGSDDEAALKRGLAGAIARAIDSRYPLEAARAEARAAVDKAKRDLEKELNSFYPQKKEKLRKQLDEGPSLSKELLARLGKKYAWTKDVDLSPGRDLVDWGAGEKPDNPLWIERIILKRKPPAGLAAIDFHLRNAKDLLWAARMVPAPAVMPAAFNSYRARLCQLAGRSANRSAAAQIGAAGFKAAPADAAKTAQEAWNAYTLFEPIPLNDGELRHQYILAYAYGSKKEQAQAYFMIKAVMKQSKAMPSGNILGSQEVRVPLVGINSNRDFWYDAARICSLVGDVPNALSCFYAAIKSGFHDWEAARVDPDLAVLRAGAPAQFDKAIAPSKK